MNEQVTDDEMLESLRRSGYLLESRLVRALDTHDFFIEPNVAFLDKKTGVSREIDIVAETSYRKGDAKGVFVKSTFVIEAINNIFPVLLLTPNTWTPGINDDDFLLYSYSPKVEGDGEHPFILDRLFPDKQDIRRQSASFCQYCAFTRKKKGDALMASHSDDLYNSIKKSVEYALTLCDQNDAWIDRSPDKVWRILYYRPIIVLGGDLCVLQDDKIIRVNHALLKFSLHWEGNPRSVILDFATESGVKDVIKTLTDQDDALAMQLRSKKPAGA